MTDTDTRPGEASDLDPAERYGFTDCQREAFDALMAGGNIFLTGNAGTGKSYVLNAFIEELEERGAHYIALAPTGIAAQNLKNGTTIHRTLKIGFGVQDPTDQSRKAIGRKVLDCADVVIIDEISMCRIDLFERVMNMILASKRKTGPKQVVLVGDFFQLPPVLNDDDRRIIMRFWPGNEEGYCFRSDLWRGMGFEPHVLTETVRQTDPEFIGELNRARIGDAGCVPYFNERSISRRAQADEDDLWLCATNRMASTINEERVSALEEQGLPSRTYVADVDGDVKPSDEPTEERLHLTVGARVMMLVNRPTLDVSNGSIGTVTDLGVDCVEVLFDGQDQAVEVGANEWEICKSVVSEVEPDPAAEPDARPGIEIETVGTFKQIPLRLAFAITIHKSQGQTFDRCVVHSKVFGAGMLYVALSRCTNYEGMTIWPKIERGRLFANAAVVAFYDAIERGEYSRAPLEPLYQDAQQDALPGLGLEEPPWSEPAPAAAPLRAVMATPPAGGSMFIECPLEYAQRVQGYIDALMGR